MFSGEEYYKLYNDRVESKYLEMKRYLEQHLAEMVSSGGKGFRDRMFQYSKSQAELLVTLTRVEEKWTEEFVRHGSYKELKEIIDSVYHGITREGYAQSVINPQVALSLGGKDLGPSLAAFAALFQSGTEDAFSHRRFRLLHLMELYVELHKQLLHGQVRKDSLMNLYRQFITGNLETDTELNFLKQFSPNMAPYTDVVEEEDLSEPYYLMEYGLPMGERETVLSTFFAGLAEEEMDKMVKNLISGLESGFPESYRNRRRILISVKAAAGTEPLTKLLLQQLHNKGYETFIKETTTTAISPAFLWDHQCDRTNALSPRDKERLLQKLSDLSAENESLLTGMAGEIEIVLEKSPEPFARHMGRGGRLGYGPTMKLIDETERLKNAYYLQAAKAGNLESMSKVTLVLPWMEMKETKEQTLAVYEKRFALYRNLTEIRPKAERPQQAMADALDKGSFIYLMGRGENETDLVLALHGVSNPRMESNFIANSGSGVLPGGSVHTVPVLSDTNGLFHVRKTKLLGKDILDLRISIEDGYVTEYTWDKEYSDAGCDGVLRQLLESRNGMKVAELSIGTNTEGYGKYVHLTEEEKDLPEELLEHFMPGIVIGDSRYEGMQQQRLVSPTTHKEMVALKEEIAIEEITNTETSASEIAPAVINTEETNTAEADSGAAAVIEAGPEDASPVLKGDESAEKVLDEETEAAVDLNPSRTHEVLRTGRRTRFSLPFEEIGAVSVIKDNGERQDVIREGWFVLIGTDHLNLPLIDWKNEQKAKQEKEQEQASEEKAPEENS